MKYEILKNEERVGTLTLGRKPDDLEAESTEAFVAVIAHALAEGALTPRSEDEGADGIVEERVPQVRAVEKNIVRIQAYFESYGYRLQEIEEEGS